MMNFTKAYPLYPCFPFFVIQTSKENLTEDRQGAVAVMREGRKEEGRWERARAEDEVK